MSQEASWSTRIRKHIGSEFTTDTWVLIPVCAALGFAGGIFTQALRLPIYLDALGVVLLAMLAGPWPALLAGLFTNVLEGIFVNPTYFAYAPVNMVYGLIAGYLFYKGWAKSYARLFVVGLVLSAFAVVVSSMITVFVFGGITGAGSSAVVAYFLATGGSIVSSVVKTSIIFEPIDKVLTVFIAYYIATSVPARYQPEMAQRILPD